MGYPSGAFIPAAPAATRTVQLRSDDPHDCGMVCDLSRGSPSGIFTIVVFVAIIAAAMIRRRASLRNTLSASSRRSG